jgi:hypothetical protein
MKKPLIWFVLAAVPITMLCLGMYAVGQNINRQNANDPQIQMAEDGAVTLSAGGVPAELVARGVPLIDIATSLDPWIAVYDSAGMPLEASARLDGAPPKLPVGVFDTTNSSAQVDDPIWIRGEYRVTWQPKPGVRQAVVVVQTKDKKYFVAAGRSLRLSEERTGMLGFNMALGWLGTLFVTFVLSFAGWWLLRRE